MIASSTALMQACKREAPPAKTVELSEKFSRDSKRQLVSAMRKSSVAFNSLDRDQVYHRNVSRGSGRVACVSCVEVLCGAGLNTRLLSCSCRLITARSVTLARASTRMRRLLRQQQAVRMLCSLVRG